jgi:hypothetical protein
MSTRLHLGALWVVSWRVLDKYAGIQDGHWSYAVFTSKKAAAKHRNYVLDNRFADSTVGPRRFIPRDAKNAEAARSNDHT